MSARVEGLPAVADSTARLLILGTLPGVESLRQRRYYANPRNAFWRIADGLFSTGLGDDREMRLAAAGVALWDVCRAAERPGSLDAAIHAAEPNDMAGFLAAHPNLTLIGFNGAAAARLFARRIALGDEAKTSLRFVTLPSSSPAHARLNFAEKLDRWRSALVGP